MKDWTAAERQKLRDDVPRLGFAAEIRGRNVLTLAQETFELPARGLARRDRLDPNGCDETRFLGRWKNSSRAASRRRKNFWRNSTASGAARSSRFTTNTLIELFRRLRFRQVIQRGDDVLGERIGERRAFMRVAHEPDAARRQFGKSFCRS